MEYIEIGKLKKTHGLNGELKGTIEDRFIPDAANVEAFFVEKRGEYTPFFIEYLRGKGDLIFKFEEVDAKEDATPFVNKRIYLRRNDISLTEEEIHADGLVYSYLSGYEVIDAELGTVGTILRVDEFPQQEMATVAYGDKEVFVPLLEAWIESVDKEEKTVHMALPEGLLDI